MKIISNSRIRRKPAVSILCTTYNQSEYIADALDSFLMQKTNFDFEIIIHDDNSSDDTVDIVLDYQRRYPDIITVILQEENQYSQGVNNIAEYLFPLSSGRYIALCEGDDYWIDEYKLQVQYALMEKTPNVGFCIHASNNVNAETKEIIEVNKPFAVDCYVDYSYLIRNIHPFATCSYFVRSALLEEYFSSPISSLTAHGDHKMGLFFGAKSKVFYMSNPMGSYRVLSKGSVTSMLKQSGFKQGEELKLLENRIDLLEAINVETDYVWCQPIKEMIDELNFNYYWFYGGIKELVQKSPIQYRKLSFVDKVKLRLRFNLPKAYKFLKRLNGRH